MKQSIIQKLTVFTLTAALTLGCFTFSPIKTNADNNSSSNIANNGLTLRNKSIKIGNYRIYIGKKAGANKYPIYKKNLKTKKKVLAGYSKEKNYYTYKKSIIVMTNKGYLYKTKLTQKKPVKMKNFKKKSRIIYIYSKKYMITQKGRTLSKLNISTGKSEVLTTNGPLTLRIFVLDGDVLYYMKHILSKNIYVIYSYNLKDKTTRYANLPLGYIPETGRLVAYKDSIYFTVNVCKVLEDSVTNGGFGSTADFRIMKYSPSEGLSEFLANGTIINFSGNYMYYHTGQESFVDNPPIIHQYNMLTKEDKTIVDTRYLLLYGAHIIKVTKKGSTLTIYTCDEDHPELSAVYTINEDGTNLFLSNFTN